MPVGIATPGSYPQYIERVAEQAQVARDAMDGAAVYPKFVDKKSSKKLTIRTTNNENAGGVSLLPTDARHPNQDFALGYSSAITQYAYGAKFTAAERFKIYAQYDFIADAVRQLRMADGALPEYIAATYLDFGDVTTGVPTIGGLPMAKTTGVDSVALFSTAHRWRNNALYTWANKSATNYDLTRTAFQAQYTVMRAWKDNADRPLNWEMKGLIVSPTNHSNAYVVLNTDRQPETNNNALNEVPTMIGKQVVETQWVTNQTRWFIQTKSQHGICFYTSRMGLVRQGVLDNDTDAYFIKIDTELGHGVPTYLMSLYLVTN